MQSDDIKIRLHQYDKSLGYNCIMTAVSATYKSHVPKTTTAQAFMVKIITNSLSSFMILLCQERYVCYQFIFVLNIRSKSLNDCPTSSKALMSSHMTFFLMAVNRRVYLDYPFAPLFTLSTR